MRSARAPSSFASAVFERRVVQAMNCMGSERAPIVSWKKTRSQIVEVGSSIEGLIRR
jgi:hypothetical protein